MSVTRTEAIKAFLTFRAPKDLADLYEENMEVQVNVRQGDGEEVEGETGKGVRFKAYRDPHTGDTWKSFRIPWANGEYEDNALHYSLDAHAECIGLSGWDYQARCSRWVGFDFDSLVGHKKGLTDEQLRAITEAVSKVEWVTTRRSRSGRGIHLYVFLDPAPETDNRHEHSALARAVLMRLSAASGVDLSTSVDVLGCMLWVWHREVKGNGLSLIKQGTALATIPENWRDQLPVAVGKAARGTTSLGDLVDDLVGLTRQVVLDAEHKRLLRWFEAATGRGACWWWDSDRQMLVCHTQTLAVAHKELQCKIGRAHV